MNIFDAILGNVLRDDAPGGTGGAAPPVGAPSSAAAPPPAAAAQPGVGGTPGATPAAGAPGQPPVGSPPAGQQPPAAQPPAGTPYRPEGLPDHLLGKTDQETMDKMQAALKGYREKDGTVPETADAYKAFNQVDAAIKPYVDVITADPLFNRLTEKAKERGIPLQTFQGLTTDLLALGAEMGIYEPPIDVAAERAALTPDTARHLPEPEQKAARDRRMNDNFAWLDQQVAPPGQQGLGKEAVDFAKQMLGDRAVGHQFIEHFRGLLNSRGPLTQGQQPQGGDAKAEIERRLALPENTFGHPQFNRASYDQLQKDARAVYGDR